jgi:hypothetical protein
MLIAHGVSLGIALTAVALFRAFDMWIPLGVGLAVARRRPPALDDPDMSTVLEPALVPVPAGGF